MTIDERLGLKNPEFNERYEKLIELVGLEAIVPYIPATKEEVKEAAQISRSLNSIPLSKWDRAAGYSVEGTRVTNLGYGANRLLVANGINCYSLSECVSLLKHAALKWIEA